MESRILGGLYHRSKYKYVNTTKDTYVDTGISMTSGFFSVSYSENLQTVAENSVAIFRVDWYSNTDIRLEKLVKTWWVVNAKYENGKLMISQGSWDSRTLYCKLIV